MLFAQLGDVYVDIHLGVMKNVAVSLLGRLFSTDTFDKEMFPM